MKHLRHAARRAALLALGLFVVLFVVAVWFVRHEDVSQLDRSARALVRDARPLTLERPMRMISELTTGYVLLPVTFATSVFLWRRRHRVVALSLPAVGLTAVVVLGLTKWVVDKPRPTLRGYGFPSGHVFAITVFVVVGAYLLWLFSQPRSVQCAAWAVGILAVVTVGYSRLYVNAHWFSDVVGGLLAGLSFAVVAVLAIDRGLR